MKATQLFFFFLKQECTLQEYRFFKKTIVDNHGNKYFRKRPLYKPTFVEDYLSRNNRALNNFMTRMFILAPNLTILCHNNPRFKMIAREFNERNKDKGIRFKMEGYAGDIVLSRPSFNYARGVGMYVRYYQRKWNKFLRENVVSDKKINSPFKKGETYDFKLKIEC